VFAGTDTADGGNNRLVIKEIFAKKKTKSKRKFVFLVVGGIDLTSDQILDFKSVLWSRCSKIKHLNFLKINC